MMVLRAEARNGHIVSPKARRLRRVPEELLQLLQMSLATARKVDARAPPRILLPPTAMEWVSLSTIKQKTTTTATTTEVAAERWKLPKRKRMS